MERRAHRVENQLDTVVAVGDVRFGSDPFPVIAGPCSIESEEQIHLLAKEAEAAGARVLRGNTLAVMGSPYDFKGLGMAGVRMLAEAGAAAGLPTVTQISEPGQIEEVIALVEMIEIGSGNMQNFELLRAAGESHHPVMLKRGPSATFDEWLWAAEYILAEGNENVVMCERGIRAFEKADTLDIAAVPKMQELSHLPVVVFPSHAVTVPSAVGPLALAAQGAGANGVVIEIHENPAEASINQMGQIPVGDFGAVMDRLGIGRMRGAVDLLDRDIVRMLARRRELTSKIGEVKADRGMPVYAPTREGELLGVIREEAELLGLDKQYVSALFNAILEDSRAAQRRARGEI
jgi:3-deoxy-7-phosphoheptulonate synthase